MEHPVQGETKVVCPAHGNSCKGSLRCAWFDTTFPYRPPDANLGKIADEKINDVIRMTVATVGIVMESEGRYMTIGSDNLKTLIAKTRERTLDMLQVKEGRK